MIRPGPAYVYGILRRSADLPPHSTGPGIGDAAVERVEAGDLAALVSPPRHVPVPSSRRNLVAHTAVLERAMRHATLLPVRFGTVAPSRHSLIRCLDANTPSFLQGLTEIDGMIEIGVKASWKPKVVFDEIIDSQPRLRALRDRMRQRPARDTYAERIELGRQVEAAMAERREAETGTILAALRPLARRDAALKVLNEEMILNHAFLVPSEEESRFDSAMTEVIERFGDRITFRYMAPVPPYNFVSLRADWLSARAA